MSAASGDVLGITCVLMPSGFNVAVVVPPTPTPTPSQQGTIGGRPRLRPSPTYVEIASTSLIPFIGSATIGAAAPLEADGVFEFAGAADIAAAHALEAEGTLLFTGSADATPYYERDVFRVLRLVMHEI